MNSEIREIIEIQMERLDFLLRKEENNLAVIHDTCADVAFDMRAFCTRLREVNDFDISV